MKSVQERQDLFCQIIGRKHPPKHPTPQINQCRKVHWAWWQRQYKEMDSRETGGVKNRQVKNRQVQSLRRWNFKKTWKRILFILATTGPLTISNFYSCSPKMKGADANLYRELVDWRKVVLVLGVQQTLVKPQAGERHSPSRNRGHRSVPAMRLSFWFLPSTFC